MTSLKIIKSKIRSVGKTLQVTKAIEAVSAIKMRTSQERALLSRPYARAALAILQRVSGSVDALRHPLTQAHESSKKTCLLVVTSDKGLAGGLNSAVLKEVRRIIEDKQLSKENVVAVCIGNKGFEFLSKRGYAVLQQYTNIGDNVSVEEMKDVAAFLVEHFMREEFDRCFIIYNNFISTFEQEAVSRLLLPISFEEVAKVIKGIVPEKGKYAMKEEWTAPPIYTIEPNPEEVFNELLPSLISIQLYHSLLEAKASEHSARMVAMKNASDKAEEMTKDLTLSYNKARQSQITSEMSEIIGGMEALK